MQLGASPFVLHKDLEGNSLTSVVGRRHALLPSLWFFLIFWSVGGIAIVVNLVREYDPLLASGLGYWAAGWFFLAFMLISILTDKEVLRFDGTYLRVIHYTLGLGRHRQFSLADIRQLSVGLRPLWVRTLAPPLPFAIGRDYGAVTFVYRGRTVFLLPGLNDLQAGMVVGWLKKQLPES